MARPINSATVGSIPKNVPPDDPAGPGGPCGPGAPLGPSRPGNPFSPSGPCAPRWRSSPFPTCTSNLVSPAWPLADTPSSFFAGESCAAASVATPSVRNKIIVAIKYFLMFPPFVFVFLGSPYRVKRTQFMCLKCKGKKINNLTLPRTPIGASPVVAKTLRWSLYFSLPRTSRDDAE
jgi:hypothetical protein